MSQLRYAANASKLHRKIGDMLVANGYRGSLIKQEVPCKTLIDNYPNGQDRYDYVLPKLGVIIELHGEQHRSAVDFGGQGKQKAKRKLAERISKDIQKQKYAEDAGWGFIEIWHDEDIDWAELSARISQASAITNIETKEKPKTFQPASGFGKAQGFSKTKQGTTWHTQSKTWQS